MPRRRFEMMVPVGSPWGDETTKRLYLYWFGWLITLVLLLAIRPAGAREAGEIVSVLGAVEVLREGGWQAVGAGEALKAGEVVRTGESSRVAIQLANGSQLKLNANSRLELKTIAAPTAGLSPASIQSQPSMLHFMNGEIWIRTIGEPLEIQTLPATATVRGTEFNLAVGPGDIARLAVLDGRVEFSNPQGSVLVAASEQATAKVGEAPRKTVLLDPLDAVQWSLYYPGLVSYRDYPLSGIDPSRLRPRIEALRSQVAASLQDATALIELGEASFDAGDRREARQAFVRALRIDPRQPRARAGLGWVYLEAGEVDAALGEFQQSRPPTLMALIGQANALYRLNRLGEADQVLAEAKKRFPRSPAPWTQAALNDLIRGRVTDARQALDRALALDPNDTLGYGLRSNIHLVQNQKEQALESARRAVATNPSSPTAYLDLSLAYQAEFQLEDALRAARQAVGLDPENPRALIQESRLLFGMGRIKEASKSAEKARQRAPQDALINSTWGFLQLARYRVDDAVKAFEEAIAQDSTLGEPHVGLGIAWFQRDQTEAAVEELRKATLLDPRVSLYNSYLGKAYYETKQNSQAKKYLALAEQLDPRDPTPYFYDAVRLQSVNRPVEAVRDLQKSIELNDDRGVYRSRLLLDKDLAARGAQLGYVYRTLGLEQPALLEGWRSLSVDQTNYSAHRLLADVYSGLPMREMARDSELLQAQLLQPININPVQPLLSSDGMAFLYGIGPYSLGLNEYTHLFYTNGSRFHIDMLGGEKGTLVDNVIVSGLNNNISYSIGQFYSETNGYHDNGDSTNGVLNAFVQAAPAPELSILAELRRRDVSFGDILLPFFDQNNYSPTLRIDYDLSSARVGFRYNLSPRTTFLGTYIHADQHYFYGADPEERYHDVTDLIEFRQIFQSDFFSITSGLSYLDGKTNILLSSQSSEFNESFLTRLSHINGYLYGNYNFYPGLSVTLGLSADSYEDETISRQQVNPKFGFIWQPFENTMIRGAAFRSLKRPVISSQTIEPTLIAGFNQFFDGTNGEDQQLYGAAIDQKINENIYIGTDFSVIKSIFPYNSSNIDTRQELSRAYFYLIFSKQLTFSAQYQYETVSTNQFDYPELENRLSFSNLTTQRIPLEIRYFHPSGFFAWGRATYFDQKGEFPKQGQDGEYALAPGSDHFTLFDGGFGYWLSKPQCLLSLQARNLFDQRFNLFELDNGYGGFIPRERVILARFSYDF